MPILLPIDAVVMKDGRSITTSLKVAEVFGKEHKHVLRDIEALECSENFRKSNFGLTFRNVPGPKNSTRQERLFEITKDGFTFLVMGYRGKKAAEFKEAYIDEFNRLEAKEQLMNTSDIISISSPKDFPAALRTFADIAPVLADMARVLADEWEQRETTTSQPPTIAFLNAWWQCLGPREITAKELYQILSSQQCPSLLHAAIALFGPIENWTNRKLSNVLRTWSRQPQDDFSVLNKGQGKNGNIWYLERNQ